MTRLRIFLSRLWALVRSRQMDRDIDDEIASHLAEATDEYIRQGLSPEDARRAARRSFGGVTQTKEVYREVRSFMWLDDLTRDLRHALRTLRRAPAFTAAALLTLALGIGANAAIFSILNGVLLRPLDYPRPEQLMYVTTQYPLVGAAPVPLSAPEYLELREVNRSFAAIGAFSPGAGEVNLTTADGARRVRNVNVDEHLLNALGLQAAQGRLFARGETDRADPASTAATGRDSLARVVAIRVWRTADRRENGGSEQPAPRSDRHHAAWRRCLGYPARDLVAAGVDPVQPRESPRSLPPRDRPIEGRCHAGGSPDGTEDAQRTVGRTCRRHRSHVCSDAGGCRGADVESRRRSYVCKCDRSTIRSSAVPAGRSGCFRRPPDWCC